MIGKPHSLIRHPDMPRCVFKLLWDTIAEGQAIAAYVKNRAKTGEPYWVMATVVPCEGGYLSVRLKPSTPYFDVVREAYRDLRKLELELGGEREIDRKRAMAAAAQRLGEVLADAGFADYTAFMQVALAAEIASRASEMTSAPPRPAAGASPLEAIGASCRAIGEFLDSVFGARLDGYGALSSARHKVRVPAGSC
jgi:aerotaxis receptor